MEFKHASYVIKRKFVEWMAQRYTVLDPEGKALLHIKMKPFKLRDDVRIFKDEALSQEVLRIQQRNLMDFSGIYDVFDSKTNQRLGTLRRQGLQSTYRDHWDVMNFDDQVVGGIEEDSTSMALVRRFVFRFLPQDYHGWVKGAAVWHFHRHLSLFLMKMTVIISPEAHVDPRIALAAGVILCAIEGDQR